MAELKPRGGISVQKVRNLLRKCAERLADSQIAAVSLSTRFQAAYDAGFCCALAVLEVNNLQSTDKGHHRDTLESAAQVLGLKGDTAALIPTFVQTRNSDRYDAAPIFTAEMVEATVLWAQRWQAETQSYLEKKNPQALKP
jgi:hypothetical protein